MGEDDIPHWKKNPFFGERPLCIWNSYPYIARWSGLSLDRWQEICDWTSDNLHGDFYVYETGQAWVRGVIMMDINDFIHLKLRFHGN